MQGDFELAAVLDTWPQLSSFLAIFSNMTEPENFEEDLFADLYVSAVP